MLLRVPTTLVLWLVVIGGSVQLAQADMYVYRDARGHQHFTNLVSKIPPTYRSRARIIVQSKGPKRLQPPAEVARVSPHLVEDLQVRMWQVVPPLPPQTVVTMPSPPQTAPPGVPPAPSFTQARPLSTSQYGRLTLRMTEPEVLRRLGPPAYVLNGRSGYRNYWYYPHSENLPETQLTFTAGKLTIKQRGWTEVR